MSASDLERDKQTAWAKLCYENACVCKVCGAVPEVGQRLERDLCDDCKLRIKNE